MINYVKKISFFIIIVLLILCVSLYIKKTCYMDDLPQGILKNTYYFSNGKYTLNTYLYSPGALVNFSLRVEAIDNETNNKRNIYWSFDETNDNVEWVSEEKVIINGKKINLIDGWYNCECLINNGVSE